VFLINKCAYNFSTIKKKLINKKQERTETKKSTSRSLT